jgi:hypothetical protein
MEQQRKSWLTIKYIFCYFCMNSFCSSACIAPVIQFQRILWNCNVSLEEYLFFIFHRKEIVWIESGWTARTRNCPLRVHLFETGYSVMAAQSHELEGTLLPERRCWTFRELWKSVIVCHDQVYITICWFLILHRKTNLSFLCFWVHIALSP